MIEIIMLIIIVIVWSRALWCGLVIDDINCYDKNAPWWAHFNLFNPRIRRPGLAHLRNLICHAIVCWLVYLVFGIKAALLFSIHPWTNQVAGWIGGGVYAILSLALLALCILSAQAAPIMGSTRAVAVPIIASAPWLPLVCFVGFACAYVVKSRPRVRIEQHAYCSEVFSWRNYRIALKSLGWYVVNGLFPFVLTPYQKYLNTYTLSKKDTEDHQRKKDGYFFVGAAAALIAAMLLATAGANDLGVGFLWFVLGIIPVCNWRTTHMAIAERYGYHAIPGLCYLLALALPEPVYCVVFGAWAMRLRVFLPRYDDIRKFMMLGVYAENAWQYYCLLAHDFLDKKMYGQAVIAFRQYCDNMPGFPLPRLELSALLRGMKKTEESNQYYAEAMSCSERLTDDDKNLIRQWAPGLLRD